MEWLVKLLTKTFIAPFEFGNCSVMEKQRRPVIIVNLIAQSLGHSSGHPRPSRDIEHVVRPARRGQFFNSFFQ